METFFKILNKITALVILLGTVDMLGSITSPLLELGLVIGVYSLLLQIGIDLFILLVKSVKKHLE